MSLPARITDFQPFTTIQSGQVDSEFDSLVNILNGTDQTKNIRIRSNDGSLAVARFDQLAASAKIIELYRGGVEVANFDNTGSLEMIGGVPHVRFTRNIATNRVVDLGIDNADNLVAAVQAGPVLWTGAMSTGVVTFPAQPVFPNMRTRWAATFIYPDLSTKGVDGNFDEVQGALIPSNGSNFVCTHIFYKVASGGNTGGTIIDMRKQPFNSQSQTTLGSFNLNPAAGTLIGVGVEQAITPHTFGAGDFIYPIINTQAGQTDKMVWVGFRGYQTFVNG